MDFNGQYLGAYNMRLSYISDCLRRMDSRSAQTGALKKANAIIKHSRQSPLTTFILKSYNANPKCHTLEQPTHCSRKPHKTVYGYERQALS